MRLKTSHLLKSESRFVMPNRRATLAREFEAEDFNTVDENQFRSNRNMTVTESLVSQKDIKS